MIYLLDPISFSTSGAYPLCSTDQWNRTSVGVLLVFNWRQLWHPKARSSKPKQVNRSIDSANSGNCWHHLRPPEKIWKTDTQPSPSILSGIVLSAMCREILNVTMPTEYRRPAPLQHTGFLAVDWIAKGSKCQKQTSQKQAFAQSSGNRDPDNKKQVQTGWNMQCCMLSVCARSTRWSRHWDTHPSSPPKNDRRKED